MKVIKKDGTLEEYNEQKIIDACNKAARRAMVELTEKDYTKILNDVYQKTGNHCIVGHSSLAENVYCTSFENGTSVAVNYSDQDFVFEGQNVPAKGYCLFSTEK